MFLSLSDGVVMMMFVCASVAAVRGTYECNRLWDDVVGWLVFMNCALEAYGYCWTLIGNCTPEIHWYLFQPPSVTSNVVPLLEPPCYLWNELRWEDQIWHAAKFCQVLVHWSMIKDCHIYCILSCTGWTSWSGYCISLLWWSTDVSRTRRRSVCRTTVCQSLKLPVVSNCDLPLVISFYLSHDIVSEHSAVGLLQWLARRSGTHWQMNCELTLVIGLN